MKPVNEMIIKTLEATQRIGSLNSNKNTSLKRPKRVPTKQDADFVDKLFEDLKGIFPAWRTQVKTDREEARMKKQWMIAFVEERITSDKLIQMGLKRARQYRKAFLPSVGMFIGWCKESACDAFEIPPFEEIFRNLSNYQAGESQQLDRFSYFCWRDIDTKRFKESRSDRAERLLEYTYEKMLKMFFADEEFPEQPKAIEHIIPSGMTDEQQAMAKARLNNLRTSQAV